MLGAQTYYVLISGRWFTAKALAGPWSFVPAKSLPADFAKIPADHPMADVLISVPDTPQAREAAIANQIPQTATVQRDVQPTPVVYDGGEPQWKPIDGTPLSYAYNTAVPVIRVDPKTYYMVQNGVWFSAGASPGPVGRGDDGSRGDLHHPAELAGALRDLRARVQQHADHGVRRLYAGLLRHGDVLRRRGGLRHRLLLSRPTSARYWYPPPYYTYGYGAGFATGFFFGFAIGGGWHGPCCYGGGGVYISHHNNINVNNSYNRWGGKSTSVSGPGGRNVKATQVGKTTLAKGSGSNNVYAGRDGNVYRRDDSGNWQQHGGKGEGWSDVATRPAAKAVRADNAARRRATRRDARSDPSRETRAVARPAAPVARPRRAARAAGPAAERGLPGRRRGARRRRRARRRRTPATVAAAAYVVARLLVLLLCAVQAFAQANERGLFHRPRGRRARRLRVAARQEGLPAGADHHHRAGDRLRRRRGAALVPRVDRRAAREGPSGA